MKVQPEELEAILRLHRMVKVTAVFGGDDLSTIVAVVSLGDQDSNINRNSVQKYISEVNRRKNAVFVA